MSSVIITKMTLTTEKDRIKKKFLYSFIALFIEIFIELIALPLAFDFSVTAFLLGLCVYLLLLNAGIEIYSNRHSSYLASYQASLYLVIICNSVVTILSVASLFYLFRAYMNYDDYELSLSEYTEEDIKPAPLPWIISFIAMAISLIILMLSLSIIMLAFFNIKITNLYQEIKGTTTQEIKETTT